MTSTEEEHIIAAINDLKVDEKANLYIENLVDKLDYDLSVMQGHQISDYFKWLRQIITKHSKLHLS